MQIQIVTSGSMSGSINSNGVDLNNVRIASIEAVYTGSPVGTLKLQVSDDIVAVASGSNPAANVANWIDYTGSSQSVAAAGSFLWNIASIGYRWVRMVYTSSSGSGTLNAYFNAKD